MASDWQSGKNVLTCNKYMFENKIACDVTFLIGVDKEEVQAHKYVLISRSSVFYAMLCGLMATPGDNVVIIPDIDVQAFTKLLRYLYWEDAEMEADTVMAVFYAARKYAVQGLETSCREYLKSNKSVDNVCTILEQAHLFDDAELQSDCLQFIFTNPTAVLKSPGFQDLSSASLERILESDDLAAPEEDIFDTVLTWADSECCRRELEETDEHRRTVLGRLLYLIRFPIMDKKYFTDTVSRLNILSHNEKIELFQCLVGDDRLFYTHFTTKDRSNVRPRDLKRCCRFRRIPGNWGLCSTSDAISFTSSQDIKLHGVLIYGCISGTATYDVTLTVYDDEDTQVGNTKQSVPTNDQTRMYEVLLPVAVAVNASHVCTVQVTVNGGAIMYHGCDGKVNVTVENVIFYFFTSTKSVQPTTANSGQIPGLLFR